MATPHVETSGTTPEGASDTARSRAANAASRDSAQGSLACVEELKVPAARPDVMGHLESMITELTNRLDRHEQRGQKATLPVSVPAIHLLDVYSRLLSQPLIEQAKGVLMATYRIDADSAFQVLKRFSQAENVKLRDLAQSLVNGQHHTDLSPTELLQAHAPRRPVR